MIRDSLPCLSHPAIVISHCYVPKRTDYFIPASFSVSSFTEMGRPLECLSNRKFRFTTHQSRHLTLCLHSTTGDPLPPPPPVIKARRMSSLLQAPLGPPLFAQSQFPLSTWTITPVDWDARYLPHVTLTPPFPVAPSANRSVVPRTPTTPLAPPATLMTQRSSTAPFRQKRTLGLGTRQASWTPRVWTVPSPSAEVPPCPLAHLQTGDTPRIVATRLPLVRHLGAVSVGVAVVSVVMVVTCTNRWSTRH